MGENVVAVVYSFLVAESFLRKLLDEVDDLFSGR
jgi:hypothetical protein